jgi:hypothetical protein
MSRLDPRAAGHLVKICNMFSSSHDGERAAAARLADQHIRRLGLSWGDVICVDAHWRTMARACHEHLLEFDEYERRFVESSTRWRGTPSDRQIEWLAVLFERIGGGQ